MEIVQKTISLPALPRGCQLITDKILSKLPELHQFRVGLLKIFLQRTAVRSRLTRTVALVSAPISNPG
jgi:hypothetical protein